MNKNALTNLLIISVLLFTAGYIYSHPPRKAAPEDKMNLAKLVPEQWAGWQSYTYDTQNYADQWQSINELLAREYANAKRERLIFLVEYSSDLRRNFSFHFPENCYNSEGNEITSLPDMEVKTSDGRLLKLRTLYIRGVKGGQIATDRLVAYWVVMDQKRFHHMFSVKLDQMLAGLLRQSRQGFLVRLDYAQQMEFNSNKINEGKMIIERFVKEIYEQISFQERDNLFGR